MNEEIMQIIMNIVRRGNTAEVKKVNGQLVVVEIARKVRTKLDTTGC